MRTLYIDVYFLINFTVDILSLYFAVVFSKTPTSSRRLIVSALICALVAVLILLLPEYAVLKLIIIGTALYFVGTFSIKKVSHKRKIKFLFWFFVFEALIGGIFSFVWSMLDTYVYDFILSADGGGVNRKMLVFSLIILLTIGVFKMLVSFFSNIESEGVCKIEICFHGKSFFTDAFVDSGNLAVDPMDMRPVLLLKKCAAEQIFPENVIDLRDPDSVDKDTRKRIRLIPISRSEVTHVLTGIRVDEVYVINKNKKEEISVTVAIDKEGGTYGGYYALMPSCALENVSFK